MYSQSILPVIWWARGICHQTLVLSSQPDHDLILDRHPRYRNIIIGAGFSGEEVFVPFPLGMSLPFSNRTFESGALLYLLWEKSGFIRYPLLIDTGGSILLYAMRFSQRHMKRLRLTVLAGRVLIVRCCKLQVLFSQSAMIRNTLNSISSTISIVKGMHTT